MENHEITPAVISQLTEIGKKLSAVQMVPGCPVPFIVKPDGEVRLIPELVTGNFEKPLTRIRQAVAVSDPGAFVKYYRLFADANSRVFAWEPTRLVSAVLDYHQAGQELAGTPRHGEHKLNLQLIHSDSWNAWVGANNKKMSQVEFAEFLEQNDSDLQNPGSLRDVCNDLQVKTEGEYTAMGRAGGNVKFRYSETTSANTGNSLLSIPETFDLRVPVFIGGIDVPVKALLRFRLEKGKLALWYTLVRPENAVIIAFSEARDEIAEDLNIQIINGKI